MKRKWSKETVTDMPSRPHFHCMEGYRWDRMALYGDVGRNVPSYFDDAEIDDVINQAWENRHWLCDR